MFDTCITIEFCGFPENLQGHLQDVFEEDDEGWEQDTYHRWEWYTQKQASQGYTCWGLSSAAYIEFRDWFVKNGVAEGDEVLMLFSW